MMKDRQQGKILRILTAVILLAACLFLLALPLPKRAAGEERYECVWSDGSVTRETYDTAYNALDKMSEEGVCLVRNGLTGVIASEATEIYKTLSTGSLSELLELRVKGTRIDRAALYRTFGNTVWYEDGYLVYTGSGVAYANKAVGKELVYLGGNVLISVLKATGATTLSVRADASVNQKVLGASGVTALRAEAPYSTRDGALYLATAGGKRLIAAVSSLTELYVDEVDFCDEGALLNCNRLTSLSLPFLGSARENITDYRGELGYLFCDKTYYQIPQSLKSVRVRGGRIVSFAFYGAHLTEVNACGVRAADISNTAFAGMNELEILHTPREDVTLAGSFMKETAPCGCYVYRRI